jgi:hypothetical protein
LMLPSVFYQKMQQDLTEKLLTVQSKVHKNLIKKRRAH